MRHVKGGGGLIYIFFYVCMDAYLLGRVDDYVCVCVCETAQYKLSSLRQAGNDIEFQRQLI